MKQVLLDADADLTRRCLGVVSPPDTAASNGHTDTMKIFIDDGADFNGGDPEDRSSLHLAALWNELGTIHILVGAGADVNAGIERVHSSLSCCVPVQRRPCSLTDRCGGERTPPTPQSTVALCRRHSRGRSGGSEVVGIL